VSLFRQRAFGQEIEEFEVQLREAISKKNKSIKEEFIRFCRQRAQSFIEPDVEALKKSLAADRFETMEQFCHELEQLKSRFTEEGPKYPGNKELLQETVATLTTKAAEHFTMNTKKEQDVKARRLKERVAELEQEKLQTKVEH